LKSELSGLIAAPHTPMHADGSLDLDRVERQARFLRSNGVKGGFVCGSTGEGPSLTSAERKAVVERWLQEAPADFPVIVSVAHTSLGECRALAEHAQEKGAAGVAAIAPYYFKPARVQELVSFCAEVARAAPELPFYFYHIPALTSVALPVRDFLLAAKEEIPNLVGVKYTYEDLADFGRCVELDDGRYNMLFGRDEMLLAGLALGAKGAVGSTYNYAAPLYLRLIEAFEKGDMASARAAQSRSREFIELLFRFRGVSAGKAIMGLVGLDMGPVRLPLRDLADDERLILKAELERIGFFEYCCK
jgi:N-acetylneuraminate lyase